MKRLLLATALTASAAPALAETTLCTNILSLPATITVPGIYCLKQDLATSITSGNAITINANSVTIDFNGYRLGGLGAGPATTANGVYAVNRKNITLRNGNIRGFQYGIFLDQTTPNASSGHLIEANLLEANANIAIRVAGGSGIVVSDNRIVNTDSTPPPAPSFAGAATATSFGSVASAGGRKRPNGVASLAGDGSVTIGIFFKDVNNSRIVDNFVSTTVSPDNEAVGISLHEPARVEVARNTILDTRAQTFASGIYVQQATGPVVAQDNVITLGASNAETAYGIELGVSGTLLCRNNTVSGFATGQTSGCTAQDGLFPGVP